jgi:broad specificity phosphatase PhoE
VEVVLVRHGETEWSRDGRHTGRTDLPLTEVGERQARALGEVLRGREFALVMSSPLTRALSTARLAGFDPELHDDLAEWDYGEYDGLTTPEIREQIPDWTIWGYGALGGESVEQLAARADRVIEKLLGVEGDVLVFSHGHFLRVLTARRLGLTAQAGAVFQLGTGTMSRLSTEHRRHVVAGWNVRPDAYCSHETLPPAGGGAEEH